MKIRFRHLLLPLLCAGLFVAGAYAQAPAPACGGEPKAGELVAADGKSPAPAPKNKGTGFVAVVFSSGWLGVVLWLFLFGAGGAAIYFIVDCLITIRVKRVMPQPLIDRVSQAMQEGDVMKALKECEAEPSPLANILTSGFSHVEEGYDIIQEAISTAADLEVEKLMQKLTWISVCANIAPMLGLLGTVQGMIMAFAG
ncbi:MAG: MotA/TolQ/ExbB proton channel family protein, partial [Rubrivivax sp.]